MSRVEHIGDATLYLGDCREILPTLEAVDAVVTDPPYGTQDFGGGYGRRQNWDAGDGMGRTIVGDQDLQAVREALPLASRLVKAGWLMAFFGPRKTPDFITALSDLQWFGEVIWDKARPGLGYHIRYAHENVGVFRIGEPPRPPDALLSVIRGGSIADIHPHQKPVHVMELLVRWACPPDGIAIDPFMGSGTTGVAAVRLGRRFVGIEIDHVHFDMACRRIEAELKQPRLFTEKPALIQEALL